MKNVCIWGTIVKFKFHVNIARFTQVTHSHSSIVSVQSLSKITHEKGQPPYLVASQAMPVAPQPYPKSQRRLSCHWQLYPLTPRGTPSFLWPPWAYHQLTTVNLSRTSNMGTSFMMNFPSFVTRGEARSVSEPKLKYQSDQLSVCCLSTFPQRSNSSLRTRRCPLLVLLRIFFTWVMIRTLT